ncbi:MAG: SAM-dependent methyltransferase [Candidatus Midichloriaceae bacterium]|jgi:SAM-dependent methyltransferase|nr:SAM-dependent methyltransferase [Candidatus Midichloriaceae bacterium]
MHQTKPRIQQGNITHKYYEEYDAAFNDLKQKILKNTNKSQVSAIERMQILDDLDKFELGRFLIQYRGLNGVWSRYITLHPQNGRLTGLSSDGAPLQKFERWILDRCPIVIATQERFFIFQKLLQSVVKNGLIAASLPCGLMDDLLGLNYRCVKNFKLIGLDIDPDSLQLALENAVQNRIEMHCEFMEVDAWNLKIKDEFDVVASNGLNIYEPDDERVEELYSRIYKSLKAGGMFINGFLTPPPTRSTKSEWDASQISEGDLRTQRILLDDVLGVKWLASHRSEVKVREALEKVGFKDIRVIYDRQKLFPTVAATK